MNVRSLESKNTIFKWIFLAIVTGSCTGVMAEPSIAENKLSNYEIEPAQLSSWNHISTKDENYKHLSRPYDNYQIKTSMNDSSLHVKAVLVKKLINWHQQHSTGIEISFKKQNINFQQLTSFDFNININSEESILHSDKSTLIESNPWLRENKVAIAELISTKANFSLIFYGINHDNVDKSTLYAQYDFSLPIAQSKNKQWQQVTVTPDKLQYYWQKNYQEQNTSLAQLNEIALHGAILVAETENGKVARHYCSDDFPKAYTEVFNELTVELGGIQLTLLNDDS